MMYILKYSSTYWTWGGTEGVPVGGWKGLSLSLKDGCLWLPASSEEPSQLRATYLHNLSLVGWSTCENRGQPRRCYFLFQYNRCKNFSTCASSMIWKIGWLQWLAKMNSYHCGRSLWEMGLPNMQEWLHAKVFVKLYLCLSNFKIVFQIDKLIGM